MPFSFVFLRETRKNMRFEDVIQKLNTESTSERDKGYKFELLILNWFKIDKLYCESIDKIYLRQRRNWRGKEE